MRTMTSRGSGRTLTILAAAFLIWLACAGVGQPAPEGGGAPDKEATRTVLLDGSGNIAWLQEGSEPAYAPNEVLVKFKPDAHQAVANRLGPGLALGRAQSTGLPSIDRLNRKHGVARIRPVCKGLHRRLRKGESLEEVRREIATKYRGRANRAPSRRNVPDLSRLYKLTLEKGKDVHRAVADYMKNPNVEYAEPNHVLRAQYVPNDPYFSSSDSWGQGYDDLWGLKIIEMEQAWDIARSVALSPVVVAVVDGGVDYTHEDLAANIWTNPGEVPDNDLDDDGNGYVDDYYGYNFNADAADPLDDGGHGTHVAGTIAAVTDNGIGISGIALNVKIMCVKGLDSNGAGYASDLAEGICYAADNGAEVQNLSIGASLRSRVLEEAVGYAHANGCVLPAAAGNDGDDARFETPACLKETIAVSATDHLDQRASWSNFGEVIDVAAPGGDSGSTSPGYPEANILSLRAVGTDQSCSDRHPYYCGVFILGTTYYRMRGTSMATPHVSGVAALLLSVHPEFTNEQVRQALRLSGVDLGIPGFDEDFGHGRLSAYRALQVAPPCTAWIASPRPKSFVKGVVDIVGTASGANLRSWRLEWGAEDSSVLEPLYESTAPADDEILFSWDTGSVAEAVYKIRLIVEDDEGNTYQDQTLVRVEPRLKTGWPADLWNSHDAFFTPTLADLDGDGYQEVVAVTHREAQIYVFRHDGTLMDGWPAYLGVQASPEFSPPAVGDIDKDGKLEIFLNTGEGVHGYDWLGKRLAGWPQKKSQKFTSPVALADVNQDSYPEVISAGVSSKTRECLLYVWRRNGALCEGFPVNLGIIESFNVAVGDVDPGNPGLELVVPASCSDTGDSRIDTYDCLGRLRWSTPLSTLYPSVSLGDVNADGRLEIVYSCIYAGVGVLDSDGNQISDWTLTEASIEGTEPVLGDLDGDEDLEIVVAARDEGGWPSRKIYAWNCDGSAVAGWPRQAPTPTYTPVLADLDGDGESELITSLDIERDSVHEVYAYHGDGSAVQGFPVRLHIWEPPNGYMRINFVRVAVGDLENDGRLELAISAAGYGLLYLMELPESAPAAGSEWPAAFHDIQRRSNYSPDPVAPDQFVPGPAIVRFKSRYFEPGRIVAIVGEGFGDAQGDSLVHIGGRTFDSTSQRIKLWSDTKIKVRLPKYKCTWFKGRDFRRRKVWVTVGGVDSNIKRLKVKKPAICP